ncbi:MAG: helix-turn-helix transcriptional regulator [Myxococcales bacterium]|nr:helix-turn-helix transcriptional regulator [Myxococcales bacterium]MCB9578956.1 helix-turn-helix transcriptional regulator [Polyangiaceae bacterium]
MDVRGHIHHLGTGLRHLLLGHRREPRTLAELFGIRALPSAVGKALRGIKGSSSTRVEVSARSLSGARFALHLSIGASGELVRVSVERLHPLDASHRNPVSYEISGGGEDFGMLRRASCLRGAAPAVGVRCYEALAGLPAPCPGCPALSVHEQRAQRKSSGVLSLPAAPYRLVTAERADDSTIRVIAFPVSDGLLSELLQAKIALLARDASLSERERAVLELVLLGRSSEEIGNVLGITVRTVRFHLGNILSKVGADSRADLSRLLL